MNSLRTNGLRWVFFLTSVFVFVYHSPTQMTRRLPGNRGDALLTYSLVKWDAHSLAHFLDNYWGGFFYHGAHLPMAYSDTMMSVAVPFAIVRALVGNPVLALNIVFVALWFLSCEATYRLAMRITGHRRASTVSALCFTYSTILLAQTGHNQLFVVGLVPLAIHLELAVLESPRLVTAIAFGVIFSALSLTSSYYAVGLLIFAIVIATGWLLLHRALSRRHLIAAAAGAATIAVLLGPFALRYQELQRDPYFRRSFVAAFALHADDLITVDPTNRLLGDAPVLSSNTSRSSENYAFPGVVTVAFAAIGSLTVARRFWVRAALPDNRRSELVLLVIAGVFLALAIHGPNAMVAGLRIPTTYHLVKGIPGFAGIRAVVRLFAFTQLALAIVAAAGFVMVDHSLRSAKARVAMFVLVIAVIGATELRGIDTVVVPTQSGSSVAQFLNTQPMGPVVELPAHSLRSGAAAAYVEAPRLALATIDWFPRINGYSGFEPPGYPALIDQFNTFPSTRALDAMKETGVRYVVLHTAAMRGGEGLPSYLEPADAEQRVLDLDPRTLRALHRVDGAIIIELSFGL